MSATVNLPSGSDFSLELDLAHAIVPAQCKTKIMTTKVKMKQCHYGNSHDYQMLALVGQNLMVRFQKLSEDQNCTCTHS